MKPTAKRVKEVCTACPTGSVPNAVAAVWAAYRKSSNAAKPRPMNAPMIKPSLAVRTSRGARPISRMKPQSLAASSVRGAVAPAAHWLAQSWPNSLA